MNRISKKDRCPQWLWPVLKEADFFLPCETHIESGKKSCSLYCIDCTGPALCFACLVNHKDHNVIQIRRSPCHHVVRICDVSKFIDLSGVQPYIRDGEKIVYLEERMKQKPWWLNEGVKYSCETCHEVLPEPFRFCSLHCKYYEQLKGFPDSTFVLPPKLSRDNSKDAGSRSPK